MGLQGVSGKTLKEALEDNLEEERKAVRNFLVCFFDEVRISPFLPLFPHLPVPSPFVYQPEGLEASCSRAFFAYGNHIIDF